MVKAEKVALKIEGKVIFIFWLFLLDDFSIGHGIDVLS